MAARLRTSSVAVASLDRYYRGFPFPPSPGSPRAGRGPGGGCLGSPAPNPPPPPPPLPHRPSPAPSPQPPAPLMRHVLSATVQNVPGMLAHVAGMFASRGYNIDSLAVGET